MTALVPTDEAVGILSRHADHASAFLAMNDETRHFHTPGVDGLVAYRPAGRRYAIGLCGPIAAPEDRPKLLRAFEDWAKGQGRRVAFVQLMRSDADLYARYGGYRINQFGASWSIDLTGYSLRGRKFVKVRNMVNRAYREGLTVVEVPYEQRPEMAAALDLIDAEWLRGKGKHAKELEFMIGQRGGRGAPYRRLFVGLAAGTPVAYVSYAPVYGSQPGWLYDLTRKSAAAPPGTIEAVFATALEAFQADGAGWLHLGMTPFSGLDPGNELPEVSDRKITKIVGLVGAHGHKVYPAATQASFKLKWLPHVTHPEYNAFAGKVRPSGMFALMRLTKTI